MDFHHHKNSGFTLIEILVVIFIVGVTITYIGLSSSIYGNKKRDLQQSAQEFKQVISYAQQQAILQFKEIGVRVLNDGYIFVQLDRSSLTGEAKWINIKNDDVLRLYQFPQGVTLKLMMNGVAQTMQAINEKLTTPQILLFSNGELTPFAIELGLVGEPSYHRIIGKENGEVILIEREATGG